MNPATLHEGKTLRSTKPRFITQRRTPLGTVVNEVINESPDGNYWVTRTGWYLHVDRDCRHIHSSSIKIEDPSRSLTYRVVRYGQASDGSGVPLHPVTKRPLRYACDYCAYRWTRPLREADR